MAFTSGVQSATNRLTNAAGITVTTNAAGDITSLLGKTMAYDSAGQLAEATAIPPCPSGQNCAGQQTTLSRFNGWGQRYLRDTPQTQTVFSYGSDGHNLLSETTRYLGTSALSTTEHIWLPTASGPMPVAAVDRWCALRRAGRSPEHAPAPDRRHQSRQVAVALQLVWGDRAAEHARGRAGPAELQPALPRPD